MGALCEPQVALLSPQGAQGKQGMSPFQREPLRPHSGASGGVTCARDPNAKLCTALHPRPFHGPHNQKEGLGGATKSIDPLALTS